MTSHPPTHRTVRVVHTMGMAISIHVLTHEQLTSTLARDVDAAMAACADDLDTIDRLCSTYRPDSQVSRIRAGGLALEDADERIAQIVDACSAAERDTGGLVSAWWDGAFDPTGVVKGWAVERATERLLVPLLAERGVVAVGMNAGGDMQLATAPGADWVWSVGIADPLRPGALLAVVDVVDGAVATSGVAERGEHILDARTGAPARGAAAATVIADRLTTADVWATAAVVAGVDDLAWIADAGTRSGLVVGHDGRVRRWVGAAEIVEHSSLVG